MLYLPLFFLTNILSYIVAAAILVGYGVLIGVGKASMGGGKEGEKKQEIVVVKANDKAALF